MTMSLSLYARWYVYVHYKDFEMAVPDFDNRIEEILQARGQIEAPTPIFYSNFVSVTTISPKD